LTNVGGSSIRRASAIFRSHGVDALALIRRGQATAAATARDPRADHPHALGGAWSQDRSALQRGGGLAAQEAGQLNPLCPPNARAVPGQPGRDRPTTYCPPPGLTVKFFPGPPDLGTSRSRPSGPRRDRQPSNRLWHRGATFPNVSRRQARALCDSLSPSLAVAASAVTTTAPALLEAGRAINRLVAAGLERHLGGLVRSSSRSP
jgi:hypothetical protein